jgi:hypothetical protein
MRSLWQQWRASRSHLPNLLWYMSGAGIYQLAGFNISTLIMSLCFTCRVCSLRLQEAVIDTIVAKVQGVAGDDRCVLLLGYKDQMETMMREANPGLARRFQLSQAWYFEDYSDDQLIAIIRQKAATRSGTSRQNKAARHLQE